MDKNKYTNQSPVWFMAAWFVTAVTTLIFTLVFTFYISSAETITPQDNGRNYKLYAALPQSETSISEDIVYTDGRSKILEVFFQEYKAPLAEYSEVFIRVADKYNLDYRLLPAISMQESNGGKRIIKDSYNPFGYGIYGDTVRRFTSWEEAIERVGKALREDYLDEGYNTPTEIMAKYTPSSLKKNGAWATGVIAFMEELR